jgi:hypothetical protein
MYSSVITSLVLCTLDCPSPCQYAIGLLPLQALYAITNVMVILLTWLSELHHFEASNELRTEEIMQWKAYQEN